jgi:hypothetical protein
MFRRLPGYRIGQRPIGALAFPQWSDAFRPGKGFGFHPRISHKRGALIKKAFQCASQIRMKLIMFRFSPQVSPLIFLFVTFMAFGLLIPALGIYQDDWVFVYNAYAIGPQGIDDFMYYDGTPFASLINNVLFFVLGFKPLHWHILSLVFRWLTVWVLWLFFRKLWPQHPLKVFFVAIIFAIHPFFVLQPMAFTYAHLWVAYCVIGLSYYWMVLSLQKAQRHGLYLFLSILASAFVFLSGEYFAGLEFLRPIVLFTFITSNGLSVPQKIWRALKYWSPYLLLMVIYLYWRFFVYVVPDAKRNAPELIVQLLENPISGLVTIILNLIPDVITILLSAWYQVLEPGWLDFSLRVNQVSFVIIGFSAYMFYEIFKRLKLDQETDDLIDRGWQAKALWLGLGILVFGLIPPYVAGLYINQTNSLWNSRLGLVSMLGASLILVLVVYRLVANWRTRNLIFALLISFSIGWHFRVANQFRIGWGKQLSFYAQLIQRAPDLASQTAIFTYGEILPLMGDYPTAYAINTIYATPGSESRDQVKHWFYFLPDSRLGRDQMLSARDRSLKFRGNGLSSIVISFEPEQGECLRILTPNDVSLVGLPDTLSAASKFSNLEQIKIDHAPGPFFTQVLEIDVYPQSWCIAFQQAERARQGNDWPAIIRLYQQAQGQGLESKTGYEYLPFVEAFAQIGDFEQAYQVGPKIKTPEANFGKVICSFWKDFSNKKSGLPALWKIRLGCNE